MTREERKQYNYNLKHKIVDGVEYKQCSKCKEFKPMTEEYFYKWKYSTTDGYHSRCIKCNIEYAHQYRKDNSEIVKKRELDDYYKNKQKHLDWMKTYKTNNSEKWKSYFSNYLKKNKDKINQYSRTKYNNLHRISAKEWEDCKHYFANRCAYCGLGIEDHWVKRKGELINMDLHKEHVIHSGRIDLKNCVPACRSCNDKKWKFTLNQWYNKDNPIYTYERYYKIYLWLRYDYKKYIQKRKPKRKYERKSSKNI